MTTNDKTKTKLADRNILVVGLARSGLAAANFLIGQGALVTVTDIKPEGAVRDFLRDLSSPVNLQLGGHRRTDFTSADTIVLSPGVPAAIPELQEAEAAGIDIISEVELAYRFLAGSFVGVTGSNGKTTTTTLIGAILQQAGRKRVVAGNIGTPLTSFIHDPSVNVKETTFVVELSSFQLETIVHLRCQIALLLNITPDHMDRYPSFDAYKTAKSQIFRNQSADDFGIVNVDDANAMAAYGEADSTLFPFSSTRRLEQGASLEKGELLINWKGKETSIVSLEEIKLKGKHNTENALAAASAAFLLGVSSESTAEAIREFPGVEHRLELVRRHREVDYYNDSKATNVDSAIRAIQAFTSPLILIMGGLDKGTDFSPLREVMSKNVEKVILLGKASGKIAAVLANVVAFEKAANLEEAVSRASQFARPGQVVLLAPACASFDMFQDYEDRGRVFKRLVHALTPTDSKEC